MLAILIGSSALAVEPDEILDDPVLEERARAISRGLRCVTCQSQSIDDSNAPLAKDLRLVVRERLLAGDSDQEVMTFMTNRYGDYVRLAPAFRRDTAILWFAPGVILLLAIGGAVVYFRQIQKNPDIDDALGDREDVIATQSESFSADSSGAAEDEDRPNEKDGAKNT